MARSWSELLGEEGAAPEPEAERGGLLSRLRQSLSKSRRSRRSSLPPRSIRATSSRGSGSKRLIRADVGVRAAAELVRRLEARGEIGDLNTALADEVAALFGEPATLGVRERPSLVLVVGVNGTGKTTTIGKLAERLRQHGHAVVLGAADTFTQ